EGGAAGGLGEVRSLEEIGGAQEQRNERGLVGGALAEIRDHPGVVGGGAVKSAAEVIVEAALDDGVERALDEGARPVEVAVQQELEGRRARRFGWATKSAEPEVARPVREVVVSGRGPHLPGGVIGEMLQQVARG